MILDYPWVEVYLPETIREITEDSVKSARTQIIRQYLAEEGDIDTHSATIIKLWNMALEGQEYTKEHMQGIIDLSKVLIWEQNRKNKSANNKRIKVIQPKHILAELKRRNLEWFDVYEIHERDKYSFNEQTIKHLLNTKKKSRPSFDVTTYITKYIIEFDNKLLDLPKDKGKRWDIDEWRRTANIRVKQSWEEEKD